MTMEIKATQIQTWSAEREAQALLPVLIRKLIRETLPRESIKGMNFPDHEDATSSLGFDRALQTARDCPFVPRGKSVWEMGTTEDPWQKFSFDLGRRGEKAQPDTTFVFVSSRDWPQKKKCALNAENGGWKKVCAYDANDLEQWLEICPSTRMWFAGAIGFPKRPLEDPENFLREWTKSTSPEFPPSSLFSNRDLVKRELIDFLLRSCRGETFSLAGDTREESLAFISAVLCEDNKLMKPAAVIVRSKEGVEEAENWANISDRPRILIAGSEDVAKRFSPGMKNLNTVLVAGVREDFYGKGQVRTSNQQMNGSLIFTLPRVESFQSIYPEDPKESSQQYFQTGGSLSALHRACNSSTAKRNPEWTWTISDGDRKPVLLALMGRWDEDFEGEKDAIAEILQPDDYASWQKFIENASGSPESPLDRSLNKEGEHRLSSRLDSFLAIAREITEYDIELFFQLARKALMGTRARASKFSDYPSNSQLPMISNCSPSLRHGVVEGLLMLNWHSDLLDCRNLDKGVSNLYNEIFESDDSWLSLADVMSGLAETSPCDFIRCLQWALLNHPRRIQVLFASEKIGGSHANHKHLSLLRALELLAWDKERLSDVLALLCDLQRRFESKLQSKSAGSPSKTLHNILNPWTPQTTASLDDRKDGFCGMYGNYPDEATQLALAISGKSSRAAEFNCRPIWRDDTINPRQPSISEVSEFLELSIKIAIRYLNDEDKELDQKTAMLAKFLQTAEHWCKHTSDEVIDGFLQSARMILAGGNISRSFHKDLRNLIHHATRKKKPNDNLWERYFNILWTVHSYSSTDDSVMEGAYMFSRDFEWEIAYEIGDDAAASQKKANAERQKIIERIYNKRKIDGIVELLNFPANYREVARTLYACKDNLDGFSIEKYLIRLMTSNVDVERIWRHTPSIFGWDTNEEISPCPLEADESIGIVERVLSKIRSEKAEDVDLKEICLLHAIRIDQKRGRDYVDSLPDSAHKRYFSRAHIGRPMDGLRVNEDQTNWLIQNYINYNRPRLAWMSVGYSNIAFGDKIRLLSAMFDPTRDTGLGKDLAPDGCLVDDFISASSKMNLDSQQKGDLVDIEIKFYDSLSAAGDDRFSFIENRMGESPEFFMKLHRAACKTDDGKYKFDGLVDYMGEGFCKRVSSEILRSVDFSSISYPWVSDDKVFSGGKFRKWLAEVKKLAAEENRVKSVDSLIGCGLAHVMDSANYLMPHGAVIALLEDIRTEGVFQGFIRGRYNACEEAIADMGGQSCRKEDLQTEYADMSNRIRDMGYLFVFRIFSEIARKFDNDAEHEII